MLEVASSRTMILFLDNKALARQISCFSPSDKFDPLYWIFVWIPWLAACAKSIKCAYKNIAFLNKENYGLPLGVNQSTTASRALQISSSLCSSPGSKLNLSVPEKSCGVCGIIDINLLRSKSPSCDMSIPLISMVPLKGSTRRNRVATRVDFPAPVLPTIPICKLSRITFMMIPKVVIAAYFFASFNCNINVL